MENTSKGLKRVAKEMPKNKNNIHSVSERAEFWFKKTFKIICKESPITKVVNCSVPKKEQ